MRAFRPNSDAIGIYRLSPKVFCFLVVLDILEVEDGVVIDEFVGSILPGLMETAARDDETAFLQFPESVGEDSSM